MRAFDDCCAKSTISFPNSPKLKIGILNIMPSDERAPTEQMFERRFGASGFPIEIVWLHPHADRENFRHTDKKYVVPTTQIYNGLDYLFRTGANAAYVQPEDNYYLQCLRDSRVFTKGSTSLCWAAGQIYADDTGQVFSDLLMSKDVNNKIKRAGYFDYAITKEIENFKTPSKAYMACSRHFKVDARTQSDISRQHGFQPIAISTTGHDIAGFAKGNDLLFFVHTEYGPDRLRYETLRDMNRTTDEARKKALSAKFAQFGSMEKESDELGQRFFDAVLKTAFDSKFVSASSQIYAAQKIYA